MIFEGNYKQKENKVNQSPYLWYAHEKFKEIFGALFIFGSLLNESSDKHIINTIKNNKTLTYIFVGLYDAAPEIPQITETANALKTAGKTVEFFNSKNITQWDVIQPESK